MTLRGSSSLNIVLKIFIKEFICALINKNMIPDILEWVDVRDKWNFRAGCIEQILCGYMYTRVRVPSKEKTRGMPGTDMYLSCPSNR